MEKRAHPRIRIADAIELVAGSKTCRVGSLNISLQGIAVLADERIPLGPCRIQWKDRVLEGRVLYEHAEGRGRVDPSHFLYHYGIKFNRELTREELEELTRHSGRNRS